MSSSARELYLSSLDSDSELSARRLAETSGVPDNDPLWLMLNELHRSVRQITNDTNLALSNDRFVSHLSAAVASQLANNERITSELTSSIRSIQEVSLCAVRSVELTSRNSARRLASTPLTSVVFAFALAVALSFAATWSTYHVAAGYGQDIGYRVGFHDGQNFERRHR